MKTTEHKPTSISQVQKKSETPFFDHHSEQEQPFFTAKDVVGNEAFFSPANPLNNGSHIQAKLTVGQPDDKYEKEADSVADKVVQRLSKSSTGDDPSIPNGKSDINIQRKCAACEAEEENIQRKSSNTEGVASSNIESQLNSSKGGGSALPDTTRTQMESAMGADFSNVRVHTGSNAVQMSQDLNAQAFTHGSDVYFNEGKYNPSGTEGGRLLAHELTHTLQQNEQVSNIQRQPSSKTCPTKYSPATSFKALIKLVAEAEIQLIKCGYTSIEDRIHILRGLYYGTTWSVDYDVEKSPVRNLAFNIPYTGSTEPTDPRHCLDCSLFDALKKSAEVRDGKKSFDFGHAIIGMDARRSWSARNVNIPTQGGTGLDIVTWLGDLGGGAGMLSIKRTTNPSQRATSVFKGSDFGAAVNLEGDIGAFLISRDTTSNDISGLDFTGVSFLFEALDKYLSPSLKGSEWDDRCKIFLTMLGGTFTNATLNNRAALETKLLTQIKDFGLWYLINRLRQSGKFSKKTGTEASRYLVGAASEITTILLDILTACVDGKITSLRPVSDPAPSPKGDPLSEVENILGAKEKVENIVDATKKWLKNR